MLLQLNSTCTPKFIFSNPLVLTCILYQCFHIYTFMCFMPLWDGHLVYWLGHYSVLARRQPEFNPWPLYVYPQHHEQSLDEYVYYVKALISVYFHCFPGFLPSLIFCSSFLTYAFLV
jgi:hypothetical protein